MHSGESTVQVLGGRGLSHWDEPGLGPGARDGQREWASQ